MNRFFKDLEKKGVLLFDGGMGTLLYEKGVFINRCYDELNLSFPDLVLQSHGEYVKAGADVIETNTFGAGRVKLRGHGYEDKVHEINLRGAQIAQEAAGDDVLVAGSVGPLGIQLEPWGATSNEEARLLFREQVEALC